VSDPFDTDDIGIDFEAGRGATEGTWCPDWIILSGCTPQALKLYQLMRLRLNRKRRDQKVWPSGATLAVMMGMKRSDGVSPYVKELEKLGAITVKGERMPRRNVYIVHTDPEPGYDGPMVLEEWDSDPAHKLAAKKIRDAEREKRDRAKAKKVGKPQVSLDTGENRYQEQTLDGADPGTGKNRYQGTGENRDLDTGKNRDHDTAKNRFHSSREPLLREPPTPPASSQVAGSHDEEEEIRSPNDDPEPETGPADAGPTDWERESLRQVLVSDVIRDRPDRELVRLAFLCAAEDPKATTPNWLLHEACPHWQQAFGKLRGQRRAASDSVSANPAPMARGARDVAKDDGEASRLTADGTLDGQSARQLARTAAARAEGWAKSGGRPKALEELGRAAEEVVQQRKPVAADALAAVRT
jgi:hypothetical protein